MSLSDHERPLNTRGRESADDIARTLHARGYAPNMILASDAKRTKETASHLIRGIPGAQTIHYVPDFYHASVEDVIHACQKLDDPDTLECERIMLLGHNPGWAALYDYFCKGRPPVFTGFPTGACAVFARREGVSGVWYDPDVWRAVDFLVPRELNTDTAS